MAAQDFKKGTEEYMMFLDFWNLCKKYWIPEDNEQYWDAVAGEVSEFHKKYNTPYSKHFAVAVLQALEEVGKKG